MGPVGTVRHHAAEQCVAGGAFEFVGHGRFEGELQESAAELNPADGDAGFAQFADVRPGLAEFSVVPGLAKAGGSAGAGEKDFPIANELVKSRDRFAVGGGEQFQNFTGSFETGDHLICFPVSDLRRRNPLTGGGEDIMLAGAAALDDAQGEIPKPPFSGDAPALGDRAEQGAACKPLMVAEGGQWRPAVLDLRKNLIQDTGDRLLDAGGRRDQAVVAFQAEQQILTPPEIPAGKAEFAGIAAEHTVVVVCFQSEIDRHVDGGAQPRFRNGAPCKNHGADHLAPEFAPPAAVAVGLVPERRGEKRKICFEKLIGNAAFQRTAEGTVQPGASAFCKIQYRFRFQSYHTDSSCG